MRGLSNTRCDAERRRNRCAIGRGVLVIAIVTTLAACSRGTDGDTEADTTGAGRRATPDDCIVVDVSVHPRKIDLLSDLVGDFNDSGAEVDGQCVFVRVQPKASGTAAAALATEWSENADGPRPVVWAPAASTWAAVLNQRLAEAGRPAMAAEAEPFMMSPLVIAMPAPMAKALGYPDRPIGWADILELARSGAGWADYGHPEWGAFRLGKTNPNMSTSGLASLVTQAYAASGKTNALSREDLAEPAVIEFGRGIESSVVHYGDTTLTFLNNWYRADRRGAALTYVSAVATEEKSVIDYNSGNPDGILDPGEEPQPPRVPLVAVYPREGTLFADNPFIVLDAEWVSDAERAAARLFEAFIKEPDVQERVLETGYRPGNASVALGDPITAANGVDAAQPETLLELPEPAVLTELITRWDAQRKRARVLFLLDVSGSMGDLADDGQSGGPTKLDLAQQAVSEAMSLFAPDDEVALRIFSTQLGDGDTQFLDIAQYAPASEQAESARARLRELSPVSGTPLYAATEASYELASDNYDATRINAVVVLSDGMNDDGDASDDSRQLEDLISTLRAGSEGVDSRPVRVFTVAYGTGADLSVLDRISDAGGGATYEATDPASIGDVMTAVVSNF
jgi:Ca-activated chloride channel family protein